jgi:hypothetical protein
LLVQLDDLVHQTNICIPTALRLAQKLGIAALVCESNRGEKLTRFTLIADAVIVPVRNKLMSSMVAAAYSCAVGR